MRPNVRALAIADVVLGIFLAAAPWVALPGRVAVIDGGATGLGVLFVVAGVGLLTRRTWAMRFARSAALALLVGGAACLVGLAISASFLWGIYGDVGRTGAVTLGVAMVVILPYLVAFPLLALAVLRAPEAAPESPKRRGRK